MEQSMVNVNCNRTLVFYMAILLNTSHFAAKYSKRTFTD